MPKASDRIQNISNIGVRILTIREMKTMLDSDLAEVYEVETKALLQAVKRNHERFPPDFMFQLSKEEFADLRSQFVTSSRQGGRRYLPYAFTEHGAIMLASVLNSPRAVEASIFVVRAFVKMRELLSAHKEIAKKLYELESRVAGHDKDIRVILEAIRALMTPPLKKRKRIGFND